MASLTLGRNMIISLFPLLIFSLGSLNSGVYEPTTPAMFVYGDSLSDSGNTVSSFPFQYESQRLPYGSTFFKTPTGRWSNGRVIVDFLALKWGLPLPEPLFKNVDPNYHQGINFAFVGSTARNDTIVVPFHLQLQIDQYIQFKQTVLASPKDPKCVVSRVPSPRAFRDGTYVIFSGMNDILFGLYSYEQSPIAVKTKIVPEMMASITKAIVDLHGQGGNNFMVFSIMPLGCTPLALTIDPKGSRDKLGCLKDTNDVVEFANHELEKSLQSITYKYKSISIQTADLHSFALGAIANPEQYGFISEDKLKACCGYGGAYNFDLKTFCGDTSTASVCTNPRKYINWDGLHYTDALSQLFIQELVKGSQFLKPVPNYGSRA